MIVVKAAKLKHYLVIVPLLLLLVSLSCDELDPLPPAVTQSSASLTQSDVESVLAHAVEQAMRMSQTIIVAVSDREGNVLGVFRMTGAPLDPMQVPVNGGSATITNVEIAVRKARTAAFLSSNQNAFTTLTASYITRPHFPPGVLNTPGGPLFGVGISSLPTGDIMPNGSALNDKPGGIPLYKQGALVGGVGVAGGSSSFDSSLCSGQSADEIIALGAASGFPVPADKRGDNIFIDGIRFLYANASAPAANYTQTFSNINTPTIGDTVAGYPIRSAPASRFPFEGEVNLDNADHDFRIKSGSSLSASDVRKIISQATAQAAFTRAAIRRPLGVAAQVFIAVVDANGDSVLGVWRTPDATLFSFDVAVQKARTALAFSNPSDPPTNVEFGGRIRSILGLSSTQPLAMTTRAIGFLAQESFPPGIAGEHGPLFEVGPEFRYQRRLLGMLGLPPYGNGITIFPGGIPLYKNGVLVGAIGVSGDGVDQDDMIAAAGARGFEPAVEIRCDQFMYHNVRLPYIKTPRQPELGGGRP